MQNERLLKQVGLRIQKLRILQNLSQQDLAAKCDFEKSNMSRLEAGKVNRIIHFLQLSQYHIKLQC